LEEKEMSTKTTRGKGKVFNNEEYREISPADFFYRNRDLAGFSNPTRSLYSAIRELLENSLDACELYKILPNIHIRLSLEGDTEDIKDSYTYRIRIMDNGSGIPSEHIPSSFGQILFGSKYRLRQVRGTFGLGGKMAILYGQITTNTPATIISSVGDGKSYEFLIRIDILKNKPEVLNKKVHKNKIAWHGTIVDFLLDGNYVRAMPRVLEYLRQTALVNPYAEITFIDPSGRLYKFERATSVMPEPPKETLPHPYGCDVELIRRIISASKCTDMLTFMSTHFHRVGKKTAQRFLTYAKIKKKMNPHKLNSSEIVHIVQMMKTYGDFLPPDASCLSPLGKDLLGAGIKKELNPEFIHVEQRKPSAYSGFPFIVEVGIAYGGDIPASSGIILYRFANKIPLIYDEASDISRKIINEGINWRYYKIAPNLPIAIISHICSTKVPYKTVGKEFIADRPEIEREIKAAIKTVARYMRIFLSRKNRIEHERKRIDLFAKYLPKVAKFSTELAGKKKTPDIEPLLRSIRRYGKKED
jgi:DNA topoisomerase-6 subunit B